MSIVLGLLYSQKGSAEEINDWHLAPISSVLAELGRFITCLAKQEQYPRPYLKLSP